MSATATTTPSTTPNAPTNVVATRGNVQATISFDAPANNGGTAVTDYIIEYKLTTEPTVWTTFTDGVSTNLTTTVTGLTNGLSYDFRVSAVNVVGAGSASSTAVVTQDTTPNAPTNVIATRGDTQATISFDAPANNGGTAITDYIIEYKLTSEPTVWTTFTDGVSTNLTATVTGLTNGLSYDFRVSAVNVVGAGSASSTATVTPETLPGAPTSLTPTRANTQVTLAWTAPVGSPIITDYIIEYKLTSEPTVWTTFIDGVSTNLTATVTGLTNGLSYDFRVSAVSSIGQ